MMQEPQIKRKKKAEPKHEFEAGKVFGVTPAEDVTLDLDASQYRAQQGQGGDRRA